MNNRPINSLRRSPALASILLASAMSGMPALGQQEQIRERRNAPNEVLAPPPRHQRFRQPSDEAQRQAFRDFYRKYGTHFDIDRLDAAEAKRARRHARDLEWARRGARTQLATPRKKD